MSILSPYSTEYHYLPLYLQSFKLSRSSFDKLLFLQTQDPRMRPLEVPDARLDKMPNSRPPNSRPPDAHDLRPAKVPNLKSLDAPDHDVAATRSWMLALVPVKPLLYGVFCLSVTRRKHLQSRLSFGSRSWQGIGLGT